MNKDRRKAINEIINDLNDIKERVEDIQMEEEEYRDNIPENLQTSERYCVAEEACDNLSAAVDSLDDVINSLEEATV